MGKFPAILVGVLVLFLSLASQAGATGSVTLHWDQNVEPDIAGYHLFYGVTSGSYTDEMDVGNTTTATVPGLADGGTDLFVVTAYNTVTMESPPSNEVSATVGPPPDANADPAPDTDPNTDSDANTNSDPDSNTNSDPDSDANTNSDPDSNTNSNSDPDSDSNSDSDPDPGNYGLAHYR